MIEHNGLEGLDSDETMLYEVRRDLFGLFVVYFEVILGYIAGVVLLFFLSSTLFPNTEASQLHRTQAVILGVVAILLWLVLVIYTYIYRQSKLIITDKNLTQILQNGLFSRKVSELSMANVEDVTANQRGFFATIFNYGDLIVETAGEQANFKFIFCPKPNFYGKIVLNAREQFLEHNPDRRGGRR